MVTKTSLNGNLKKQYPILQAIYNVSFSVNIVEELNSGTDGVCIYYVPSGTKEIKFDITRYSSNGSFYFQYGSCDFTANVPTVLTTGEGRGNYSSTTDYSIRTITYNWNGIAGKFFIGGRNYSVANLICITY